MITTYRTIIETDNHRTFLDCLITHDPAHIGRSVPFEEGYSWVYCTYSMPDSEHEYSFKVANEIRDNKETLHKHIRDMVTLEINAAMNDKP